MSKQTIWEGIANLFSEFYGSVTRYKAKAIDQQMRAEQAENRLEEFEHQSSSKLETLTEQNKSFQLQIGEYENRKIQTKEELEKARQTMQEIIVERIGYKQIENELKKTKQELKITRHKQRRQKAAITRRTFNDYLQTLNECPPANAQLYLDRRGVIRSQSRKVTELIGGKITGSHISQLISGSPEEIEKTAEHFNNFGEGYLYIQNSSGKEIPVHISVQPQTFPYGFDDNPEHVRYATLVTLEKAKAHKIYEAITHKESKFYQDRLRKEATASAIAQQQSDSSGLEGLATTE